MRQLLFLLGALASTSALAWYADDSVDAISGRKVYGVYNKSSNSPDLGFPHGKISARLVVQSHPQFGKRAALMMSGGLADCSASAACELLIRFDDQPARPYQGRLPRSGDPEIVFILPFERLVSGLKKSEKAYVAVPFYRKGLVVFEFNVTEFDDSMLTRPKR